LQLLNKLNAVDTGHVQIAEHQADSQVLIETRNRLFARMTRHTAITIAPQEFAELFNDQWLIIDHKDFQW
jgi:hypothetical protein